MNNENLKILEKMLEQLDTKSSMDKFVKDFEVIINLFRDMKEDNKRERTELSDLFYSLQNSTEKDFADLKRIILEKINAKLATLKDGKDGKDGKNGKDVDEAKIIEKTTKNVINQIKIPTIDELEKDIPKMGEQIRDALELLQDEERLDKSAIKGLEEEFDKIRKEFESKTGKTVFVGGGSSGGGRIVKSYDIPLTSLNGVTKTFSLPAFYRIISVHFSSFPWIARKDTPDYTLDYSAYTITFTSEIDASTTLASDQTITIVYSEP